MSKHVWLVAGLALALLAGTAVVVHWVGRGGGANGPTPAMSSHSGSGGSVAGGSGASSMTGATGDSTASGTSDAEKEGSGVSGAGAPAKTAAGTGGKPVGYGRTPVVAPNANPNVAAVVEALQTRSHPERLSSLIAPAPFDKAAYTANPKAYLDVSEPGRVYQTAQPGKDVPTLRPSGPRYVDLIQGQSTPLAVNTAPGAPVTFTSADLGRFENQLTSITVAADAKGIAKVNFTASPGTINNVRILSGSPMASGQVQFVVSVQLPSAAAAVGGRG